MNKKNSVEYITVVNNIISYNTEFLSPPVFTYHEIHQTSLFRVERHVRSLIHLQLIRRMRGLCCCLSVETTGGIVVLSTGTHNVGIC
jgi:hypothetical protein